MRKQTKEFAKVAAQQVIFGGLILATLAWMAGTGLELSQSLANRIDATLLDSIMSLFEGFVWLAALIAIVAMAVMMAKAFTLHYRIMQRDIRQETLKPFGFRQGLVY